jgi:hypothetical protein
MMMGEVVSQQPRTASQHHMHPLIALARSAGGRPAGRGCCIISLLYHKSPDAQHQAGYFLHSTGGQIRPRHIINIKPAAIAYYQRTGQW